MLAKHGVNVPRRVTQTHLTIAAELCQDGLSSGAICKLLEFGSHPLLKGCAHLTSQFNPDQTGTNCSVRVAGGRRTGPARGPARPALSSET